MANEAWRTPLPDLRPWPRFKRWLRRQINRLTPG